MHIIFLQKTIEDYQHPTCNYASQACRSSVQMAVIDDLGLNPALRRVLQNNGFNIHEFTDISTVSTLQGFPVVLCDIRGVGITISPEYQGAGLVDAIRKEYPTKYIIVFTGEEIDKKYNSLLREADASLTKDADKQDWVNTLDVAVQSSLDPRIQWKRIRAYLASQNVSTKTIILLEDNYVRHLENKNIAFPSEKLNRFLAKDVITALGNISSLLSIFIPLLKGGN